MEKQLSVKNMYLLLVVSALLIVLAVGSTYAVFTVDKKIDSPIVLSSTLTSEDGVIDTINVSIDSGETKRSTLNITNDSDRTLNYVVWTDNKNDNIQLGINSGSSSGSLASGDSITVVIDIRNNGKYSENVVLGISSSSENVVLGNGMKMVSNESLPPITVNMVDYITNLYTSYSNKITVSNNSIDYYYADIYDKDTDDNTSGGLMNDRLGGTEELSSGVGNIRYYGASPNNYIYFNCDTYPSANCELWRIIGVFDGKIKIVKNDSIGSLGRDQDYNDDHTSKTYNNDWYNSSLQQFLNGLYYDRGTTISLIYYSGSSATTKTTLQLQSIGIKESTRNLILEETWYLGGYNSHNIYPNDIYKYEREDAKCSDCTYETTWRGKIALMYPSDYGYATDFNKCVNTQLINYNDSTDSYACRSNDWLFYNIMQWLLTPSSSASFNSWVVNSVGSGRSDFNVFNAYGVVPALYLSSGQLMEDGHAGTESDPYRIIVS